MSETLEVRTGHSDVSDVVRELAPFCDDTSLRLPAGRKIGDGSWVRFSVHTLDGAAVLEGVGRCQESTQEGASTYRVRLSLLSFDERNEIMFERILMMRDEEPSEATGNFDVRALREKILKPRPVAPSRPPPPPPAAKPRRPTPPRPPSGLPPPLRPRRPVSSRPVPPPSRVPPPSALPRPAAIPRPSSLPPRPQSSLPPRPASSPPRPRSSPPPRPKSPPRREATHVGPAPAPPPERPPPSAPPPPRVAAVTPRDPALLPTDERTSPSTSLPADSATLDTVVSPDLRRSSETGLRLEVSRRLVERARALAPSLPSGILRVQPGRDTAEEAVLRAALHLGLASLAALSDSDEDP